MKISKIEFENFRNFKDHGEIRCSTDGKVTIIYGKNGDGKTTLHQLFQWIIYGRVHFNKTTTDRLYNLKFEQDQPYGQIFDVMGRIDFEQGGIPYSLTRTNTYKKDVKESKKIKEDLELLRMDDDFNWKSVSRPDEVIEKLLPSGLSEYFFFDGESMIADLRVKGRDSASKLRTALFSMFDLDILEAAINHIGRTDLKTTVLGKLYMEKGNFTGNQEVVVCRQNIENAQSKIESAEKKIAELTSEKEKLKERISQVSEEIGSTRSKAEYERQRKAFIKRRDQFLSNAERNQSDFGNIVISQYPYAVISKAVVDAEQKLHLQVSKNKLPTGVTKKLIDYLTSNKTQVCICGNPLCDAERAHIRNFLNMLPPKSYTQVYNEFTTTAKQWGSVFDRDLPLEYIVAAGQNYGSAEEEDLNLKALDAEQAKSKDIEDLVIERRDAEERIHEIDGHIVSLETIVSKTKLYLNQKMKRYDTLTKASATFAVAQKKIEIMTQVLEHFQARLNDEAVRYSENLQLNIQELLGSMLTSTRSVSVSPEFSVKVYDSFGDESKSEGQFAVVSFAYIGGILKMLKSDQKLSQKEYPLVLDGPFSKLDPDQRQNVIDAIPKFAPQVILFSKDDLQEYFGDNAIGSVWTIESNDEKNVACVREGYLWN